MLQTALKLSHGKASIHNSILLFNISSTTVTVSAFPDVAWALLLCCVVSRDTWLKRYFETPLVMKSSNVSRSLLGHALCDPRHNYGQLWLFHAMWLLHVQKHSTITLRGSAFWSRDSLRDRKQSTRFAAFRAAVITYHGPTNRPWNKNERNIFQTSVNNICVYIAAKDNSSRSESAVRPAQRSEHLRYIYSVMPNGRIHTMAGFLVLTSVCSSLVGLARSTLLGRLPRKNEHNFLL